ncbi:hypothetical protein ACIBKY_51205 [Nonomuraea sp. NPDC050394]|uniref:hypothetical protein n=1 Tax=Nonomuraea sp. NPDC050394 TaxID=3364363 RepID=UPI003798B047
MKPHTYASHHGVTVTVAWDHSGRTFTAQASDGDRSLWRHPGGLPTIGVLRAVLLGHRICLPGAVADLLLNDIRPHAALRRSTPPETER